jgi:hypothetical protein
MEKSHDGFGAAADVEFFEDAGEMVFDGKGAEVKACADFFIGEALGEKVEDLAFAGTEGCCRVLLGDGFLEGSNELASDGAGHGGTALEDVTDGAENFLRGASFQKVTAGTGAQGLEDGVGVFIDGEDDDLNGGNEAFEPRRAFDAGHPGHLDVHEDDLRAPLGDETEGFGAVGAGADTFELWGAVEPTIEVATNGGAVFDDGNGDRGGRERSGGVLGS